MNKLTTFLTAILLTLTNSHTFATEPFSTKQSYSTEQAKHNESAMSANTALASLKLKIQKSDSDLSLNKTAYQTREEVLKSKQLLKQPVTLNKSIAKNKLSTSQYYDFTIYDAYTLLIEDFDEDGYYQTFSVTFDADLLTGGSDNGARVYAELYLSENGGPWVHYFTTDAFNIYGESTDDEYEVYTTLNQGYKSNQYDVLIDLYEVGYSDIVASYSSDNSDSLYALPLESSEYDPEYIVYESTSHSHGGSNSIAIICLLFGLAVIRIIKD